MTQAALSHCCQSVVVNPGTMSQVQAKWEADGDNHITNSYDLIITYYHFSHITENTHFGLVFGLLTKFLIGKQYCFSLLSTGTKQLAQGDLVYILVADYLQL